MTAAEKRAKVAATYRTIIGRNIYSQSLRDYCFKKYKNGSYYSDCSSSVTYSYKQAGFGFGIMNTVGLYNSSKLTDVKVIIKNGIIQNPELLRVGDMLLFAGKDSSRKSAGYVGHVEMVGEISGKTVMLYGHGSNHPSRKEMNAYCRSRRASKTSTALGHKGLIRVRRFIQDDVITDTEPKYDFADLRRGDKGTRVTELQEALMALGYGLPTYGADGDFGKETEDAVIRFQGDHQLLPTGIYDAETDAKLTQCAEPFAAKTVYVKAISVNVRSGPDVAFTSVGIAKRFDEFPYGGETCEGFFRITYNGNPDRWITTKYAELKG